MRRGVIVVCVANIPTAVRITTHAHTSRAERNIRPSDDVDDSIAQQRRIRNCHGEIARPNGLTPPSVAEACRHGRKKPCPDAVRPIATVDAAAGPGRCSCAHLDGSEGDLGRGARQETRIGAIDANRHSPSEWRRPTRRSTMELGGTTSRRRRRRHRHHAHPRTSPAR